MAATDRDPRRTNHLQALDRGQETTRVGAVDQPVIVGQWQVRHRTDGDHVGTVRFGDDHRALDDRAGTERWPPAAETRIGVSEQSALAADVGDGERATGQLVRLEPAGPRAAISAMARARPAIDRSSALWITGDSRPWSVSTAMPRWTLP